MERGGIQGGGGDGGRGVDVMCGFGGREESGLEVLVSFLRRPIVSPRPSPSARPTIMVVVRRRMITGLRLLGREGRGALIVWVIGGLWMSIFGV